jgi:hypothetical protein
MLKRLLGKIKDPLWILYERALFALEDTRRRNIILLAVIAALILSVIVVVCLLILIFKAQH